MQLLTYSGFDRAFARWYSPLWRLCFLSCGRPRDAEDLVFRAFLCLGAAKAGEDGGKRLLLSSALTLIEDYYLRKMRHLPKRRELEEAGLPFAVSDALFSFLRLPLEKKQALLLASDFECSPEEIAALLRRSKASVERLLGETPAGDWRSAVRAAAPEEDAQDVLLDKIYMRFAERSVGVENRIHAVRYAFNRAAPFLAIAVLALFAFAYWYVEHLQAI